ncbi:MAG: hypothetical protein GEU28_04940 [Dehalococcoidia bacterium]|nr:hypothetical protein [Dehalococcoidia bacterium]
MRLLRRLGGGWRSAFSALALVLALAVVASSCGDDDDDAAIEEETATEEEAEGTVEATEAEEPDGAEESIPTAEGTSEDGAESADFDEEAVAEFYSGKTVTMLVGFSAGGGFDTQARLMAEYLGQYIPGNPTVIVENMPGAASLVAWNHMYNTGPKDGTLIGYSEGGQLVQQLLGNPSVEFDAEQIQYLGAVVQDQFLLAATRASGHESFEEILPPQSEELVVGGIAAGSGSVDAPVIIQDVLDANINLVTGYDGLANIALAMESGEVEAFIVGLSSARAAYGEQFENDWNTLVSFTEEQVADLPDVPTILEFTEDQFGEQVITLGIIRPAQFVRPMVVAPEVPEDRVLALRAAIEQLLEDEDFLAAAEASGTDLDPLTGSELQSLIEDYFGMPEDVQARLQELIVSN